MSSPIFTSLLNFYEALYTLKNSNNLGNDFFSTSSISDTGNFLINFFLMFLIFYSFIRLFLFKVFIHSFIHFFFSISTSFNFKVSSQNFSRVFLKKLKFSAVFSFVRCCSIAALVLTCFSPTKGRVTFFRPKTTVARFSHLTLLFY